MKKITTKIDITIPFYDVDPMNIVWHGNYVKYIEQARCDFFKKINYTYTDMYNDECIYPIAKFELKYIESAYFQDVITIHTTLDEIEPALIFKYKIVNKNTSKVILKAKSMQIGVNRITKESIYKLNDNFIKRLDEYNG